MNFRERILLAISRAPEVCDYPSSNSPLTTENALNLLASVYPNFSSIISGKRVVDFGCGLGEQSIALVTKYNCSVVGVDSNKDTLSKARDNAKMKNIPSNKLSFVNEVSSDMSNSFDIAISQNSFEHFDDPSNVLDTMRGLIDNSGVILLTFGPPWLAPYGSHMQFFCKAPWLNVLFPEEVVMSVRRHYRNDGAQRYEDVESGLNKMTISKFERIISASKLKVTFKKYDCIRGYHFLGNLPLIREFLINHVSVILTKSLQGSPDSMTT